MQAWYARPSIDTSYSTETLDHLEESKESGRVHNVVRFKTIDK